MINHTKGNKMKIKSIKSIVFGIAILPVVIYANQSSPDFKKVLKLQGITFEVTATNNGSLNQLTIKPSGLKSVNEKSTGTRNPINFHKYTNNY